MKKHAVVIGAGIAGLLAARVLSDHFDRVTLLERDEFSSTSSPRVGVPQGKHIHVLWSGGANAINELFPGILSEFVAAGALAFDAAQDIRWFHQGVWKLQEQSDIVMHSCSRPLIEFLLRRRLAELPQITTITLCSAQELLWDATHTRVTGVRIERRGSAPGEEDLHADLVIDASGRGSRTPQWLEAAGYSKPSETEIGIDLAYSSRLFHVPANQKFDWKVLAVFAKAPATMRSAVIFPVEDHRWIVTLSGCLGDHPPADDAGFLEFARNLDRPELYEAIRNAEPASPVAICRFPTQLRRHYERLQAFPDGFLVIGDAMCSFNPLYGQGMSVCALETMLLGELLQRRAQTAGTDLTGLPRHFFHRARKIVDNPWLLASCSDFLYPATTGHRPFGTRILGWYIVQLLELSGHNSKVVRRFHEVLHFLKPPLVLFDPRILWQAIKWGILKPRRNS